MIRQEIFINMSHWSEIYQARTIKGILVGENIFCSVKFKSMFYSLKKEATVYTKTVFHVLFH